MLSMVHPVVVFQLFALLWCLEIAVVDNFEQSKCVVPSVPLSPSAQGTFRDLVGREAGEEAAHFNQLHQLHGDCCCLSMSRVYPPILAQFCSLDQFSTCFKNTALVLANSERRAPGKLSEASLN